MILLLGIPSEPPVAMVAAALDRLHAPYLVFNQRHFASSYLEFSITDAGLSGWMQLDGRTLRLDEVTGVYVRLMDDTKLWEVQTLPPEHPQRLYCRSLHDALIRWTAITPAKVVNRYAAMSSNASKPYQAQLIRRHGFLIPETLITNDPAAVLAFQERHGQVIYKSISGVRSIVQTLSAEDIIRLQAIRWCPTQFQAFVPGDNVRVHVVGDRVFATRIQSQATDYRYASRQSGISASLTAWDIDDDVAERCVSLTQSLGLAFSGIDLKITPEGQIYCFEVNPSPAFSYYESHTGQSIAQAVAHYLSDS